MKSQNGVIENYIFRHQNFRGEGHQNQMRTFYAPTWTHHVGKFRAIPPTDADDISQSTPDFWPIFEFQALKNCWGRPIPSEVCISKRWPSSNKCEIFMGEITVP